jgi:hypothetical protein
MLTLKIWAIKYFSFMIGNALHKRWEKQIAEADAKVKK